MRRTGENGKVMGDVPMMIKGDPARLRCLPLKLERPRTTLKLIPLAVRQQVPDFGGHRFKLRTGCRIEEIAILVNDVLYYTLPSIAAF